LAWRERVELKLEQLMPGVDEAPGRLHDAMRYSTLGGGKRLRAIAAYAAGQLMAVPAERIDRAAAAIEMVHAYSLIHDDLPAMDDDDLRRGKPTCHRAFDEATAILAGDALQSLAFDVLAADPSLDEAVRARMILTLARAIGPWGMAGGQALDLDATGKSVSRTELEAIHARKTGALIRGAIKMGFEASGERGDSDTGRLLDDYARDLGLAFQIIDDVLDEEGDTASLGKPSGSDRSQGKSTYVSLLGLAEARNQANALRDRCIETVSPLGHDASELVRLAEFAVRRSA